MSERTRIPADDMPDVLLDSMGRVFRATGIATTHTAIGLGSGRAWNMRPGTWKLRRGVWQWVSARYLMPGEKP